jgi:ABC-2 type transport system permease protein
MSSTTSPPQQPATSPSLWRAWFYLIWLSWQRQVRGQLTVWFALILLGFSASGVALQTAKNGWGMGEWREPRGARVPSYQKFADQLHMAQGPDGKYSVGLDRSLPGQGPAVAITGAVSAAFAGALQESGLIVFSRWVIFAGFLSVLLPVWSLSFATDAVGGERESRSLLWLLTRPIPRPAVYLAKFVALLPWGLGLNLGGFALLCLAAGRAGYPALRLYGPAVLMSSLAFCTLFMLLGALFRHSAIIALVYSFFLEMILGNLPGNMKRLSIGFYARCMMFENAQEYGFEAQNATIYNPVDGSTAALVLAVMTVVFLIAGMVVFSRAEYQDLS